jgi:hypothetical protein
MKLDLQNNKFMYTALGLHPVCCTRGIVPAAAAARLAKGLLQKRMVADKVEEECSLQRCLMYKAKRLVDIYLHMVGRRQQTVYDWQLVHFAGY